MGLRVMRFLSSVFFVAALLLLPAAGLAQVEYSFVKIVDTSTTYAILDQYPTLNDSGTVAFWAQERATPQDGIFTGAGGALTTVLHVSETNVQDIWGQKSINNNGIVAVKLQYVPNNTTIEARQGATHTNIVSVAGTDFTDLDDPHINDSGMVSFWGSQTGSVQGIYAGDGSTPPVTIADTSDLPGFAPYTSIGNNGYVAFAASTGGGQEDKTLYKGNGTTRTLIAAPNGQFTGVGGHHGESAINNNGLVGFMGWGEEGFLPWQGVYLGDGVTSPTQVVLAKMDGSTPYLAFVTPPAVNDNQDVAFTATLLSGVSTGLYTGPDPVADKVLEAGDTLDGKEISIITASRHCLNNRGQIVFWVLFTDDSMAIYRADPPGLRRGCPWCPPIYMLLLE